MEKEENRAFMLTMGFNGEIFHYRYNCGKDSGHGTMPMCSDMYMLFAEALNRTSRHFMERNKKEIKEIECMAYIETHPELIAKYKKSKKK